MRRLLLFILILGSSLLHAQDVTQDLQYRDTQNMVGSAFSLPINFNFLVGVKVSLDTASYVFNANPILHTAFTRIKSRYNFPKQENFFSLMEPERNNGWIEILRTRIEGGLGLQTLVGKGSFILGLDRYKGATEILLKVKNSPDEKRSISLPKTLTGFSEWRVGEQGTFQRFGGVKVSLGLGFGAIGLLNGALTFQNTWTFGLKKVSENKIIVTLNEDDLKKRQVSAGAFFIEYSRSHYRSKRFSAQFELDPSNVSHHGLFDAALMGNIASLQESLGESTVYWDASECSLYTGVPLVIGQTTLKSHYEFEASDKDDELDIVTRTSNGLLPLRNHHRIVYENADKIVLFWSSEMNRAHKGTFKKNFFSLARSMGLRGFDFELPATMDLGSTLTQISISFTREEIEALKSRDLVSIEENLKERCEREELNCQRDRVRTKIMEGLKGLIQKPWKEFRRDLGLLLVEEPALIYAMMKNMGMKKTAHYKFLSERYQSLEGDVPVEYNLLQR